MPGSPPGTPADLLADAAVDPWPLAGLTVTDPSGLVLRYPDEADLLALAAVAADGVHPPDVMPFSTPWTDGPPQLRAMRVLQWQWRMRADWQPDQWRCAFAVVVDDEVLGVQELLAEQFGVTREIRTGSWLGLAHHGRGVGTRMRVAALAFAFDHLGASTAASDAYEDNAPSLGVSRKLGYADDGIEHANRRGELIRVQRLRLDAVDFRRAGQRPVSVTGLTACRGWFDSSVPGWPDVG